MCVCVRVIGKVICKRVSCTMRNLYHVPESRMKTRWLFEAAMLLDTCTTLSYGTLFASLCYGFLTSTDFVFNFMPRSTGDVFGLSVRSAVHLYVRWQSLCYAMSLYFTLVFSGGISVKFAIIISAAWAGRTEKVYEVKGHSSRSLELCLWISCVSTLGAYLVCLWRDFNETCHGYSSYVRGRIEKVVN